MGNLVSRAVRSTAEVAIGKADLNDDRRRDGDVRLPARRALCEIYSFPACLQQTCT